MEARVSPLTRQRMDHAFALMAEMKEVRIEFFVKKLPDDGIIIEPRTPEAVVIERAIDDLDNPDIFKQALYAILSEAPSRGHALTVRSTGQWNVYILTTPGAGPR